MKIRNYCTETFFENKISGLFSKKIDDPTLCTCQKSMLKFINEQHRIKPGSIVDWSKYQGQFCSDNFCWDVKFDEYILAKYGGKTKT